MRFDCSICRRFAAPTFGGLLRHIRSEHTLDPRFMKRCGINDCPRTFKKFESWRSHVYRHHRCVRTVVEVDEPEFEVFNTVDEQPEQVGHKKYNLINQTLLVGV